MKSKKFLAALAAVAAVSAVATTGLTAQADEEVAVEAAPEAAPVVVETPAAPVVAAPVVAEPVVAEPVAAPEPAETVVTVDETPAAESVATEAAAAEAVATEATATEATTAEETVATEEATEAEAEEVVTDEVPDAEKLEDHNGYNMKQLADLSTEATITQETKKAVDYNKIYTDYVNDTVVKKIDVAALEPDTKNPDKDYVRKELLGLVSAQIYDFGQDGVDELVTVTREQIDKGNGEGIDKNGAAVSKVADFMVNVYQYDRDNDAVNLIGRQSLGTYDLTYAGYSRPWGTSAYSDFGSLAGENDSQFQLAIVGDSIYFVQEQNTDLKSQDDNDPNANRITHKIFTVDASKVYDSANDKYVTRNLAASYGYGSADDVYGKNVTGGAVSSPYVLNINRTTVTDNKDGLLYVNGDRYKKLTGNDFTGTAEFATQQAVTGYIRDQFATMKVPVNYAFLVDDVYNDDTIYMDVRFAQDDVTMLTQYNTSPNFTTIDFTGIRGGSHPAGTSEKKSSSSSSNGGSSSSSNNGGTTSSPNTGDSRVPVAAGAAAVAAAAAAVAFVSKKRG